MKWVYVETAALGCLAGRTPVGFAGTAAEANFADRESLYYNAGGNGEGSSSSENRSKKSVLIRGKKLYNSASTRCTSDTEIAPSPTADATRFTLPERMSPTAKTPGRLVSSISGTRGNDHAGPDVM